jgi:hypothetical protein
MPYTSLLENFLNFEILIWMVSPSLLPHVIKS